MNFKTIIKETTVYTKKSRIYFLVRKGMKNGDTFLLRKEKVTFLLRKEKVSLS